MKIQAQIFSNCFSCSASFVPKFVLEDSCKSNSGWQHHKAQSECECALKFCSRTKRMYLDFKV